MNIKNETQAKEFVATSVFELLEKCDKQNLNDDFCLEVAFYILGSFVLKSSGKKNFEQVVKQISKNEEAKTARRKS